MSSSSRIRNARQSGFKAASMASAPPNSVPTTTPARVRSKGFVVARIAEGLVGRVHEHELQRVGLLDLLGRDLVCAPVVVEIGDVTAMGDRAAIGLRGTGAMRQIGPPTIGRRRATSRRVRRPRAPNNRGTSAAPGKCNPFPLRPATARRGRLRTSHPLPARRNRKRRARRRVVVVCRLVRGRDQLPGRLVTRPTRRACSDRRCRRR